MRGILSLSGPYLGHHIILNYSRLKGSNSHQETSNLLIKKINKETTISAFSNQLSSAVEALTKIWSDTLILNF